MLRGVAVMFFLAISCIIPSELWPLNTFAVRGQTVRARKKLRIFIFLGWSLLGLRIQASTKESKSRSNNRSFGCIVLKWFLCTCWFSLLKSWLSWFVLVSRGTYFRFHFWTIYWSHNGQCLLQFCWWCTGLSPWWSSISGCFKLLGSRAVHFSVVVFLTRALFWWKNFDLYL